MAKRGRKPKPTAIKILEGNPGKRPLPVDEPQCAFLPSKPSSIGADALASAEWDRILHVSPVTLYTAMDETLIGNYCLAWSMLVKAQKDIDENGVNIIINKIHPETGEIVVVDSRVNPAVRIWKAASETMVKLADRLGFTPSARANLKLNTSSPADPRGGFGDLIPT